jgi:hypothetical protein
MTDLAPQYLASRAQGASSAAVDEMEAFARGDTAGAKPAGVPAAPATAPQDPRAKLGQGIVSVAKDIGTGLIESPRAVFTGVRDAYQNTINIGKELGGWLEKNDIGGGVIIDKSGVRLASGKELSNPDLIRPADYANLPHVMDNPKSVTGGLIKGVSQFLVGMKGASKLQEIADVPQLAGAAGYAMTAVKGALANFAVFDPHQQRLSNLIEKFPILQNPVTEFLASQPDDTAAEGRFKNALEGLGMGVIADGFFKGVKLLRSSLAAKTVAQEGMQKIAPEAASDEIAKLLSPEAPTAGAPPPKPPPVVVKPGVRAAEKLAAASTRTAALSPDDVVGRMVAPLEAVESSAAGRAMEPPKTFINFGQIDTPEDVQRAMQGLADAAPTAPGTAKAGVRSFGQMKLDAAHQDAWEALVSRQAGQPLGDSQMLAARQLWASATDKMAQLAQEAATSPSEANLFAFRKMLAVHNMIQNEVLGARASIARAQASMRIPVGSSAERLRDLTASLEQSGGADVARELAKAVDGMAKAGMISELSVAAEKGAGARTMDAIKEAWTLGLLTSPKTHLRNIVSNAAFVPMQIAERSLAGKIASFLGDGSSVQAGEAAAQWYGAKSGIADMFRYYLKMGRARLLDRTDEAIAATAAENPVLATGLRGAEKLDLPPAAISSEALRIPEDSWLGRGVDALGTAYSLTSNALTAEDNFFKVLGYRGEIHAQAFRQASQEVASGALPEEGLAARMAELIANPPENIRMAATDQALYQTFNESPGWFGQMLLKAKRNSLVAHVLIPFARTTANLQRASFERTPLAPLVGQWRADLMAGGARRDLAIARVTLGSMVTAAVIDATMSGQITGRGPVDPGQREALAREGWQPYSIKVGDRWFSYNGISPIGDMLGMSADIAETAHFANEQMVDGKDMEKVTLAAIAAVGGNVMNKSYLSGFASVVDALHDPNGGGAAAWARQLAGSVVPSGAFVVTRAMDPNVHAVNSMLDAIRARVPGLSKDLPVRHDLWGEPLTIDSGYGRAFDVLSPISTRKPTSEPIDKELIRLQSSIRMPPSNTSFNGAQVDLKQFPEAYERYVELAGNKLKNPAWGLGAKDLLNAIVTGRHPLSAVYRLRSDGPDGGKDIYIQSVVNQYRDLARTELLKEYPDLARQVGDKQQQQRALRMPILQ